MEHAEHGRHAPQKPALNVNLRVDPARPHAGEVAGFEIVVSEQAVGEPLTGFDVLHERLMHLVVISDDLERFDHLHPRLSGGVFQVEFAFGRPGRYKLWTEAKPSGWEQLLAGFWLDVAPGQAAPVPPGQPPGYRVSLMPPGPLPLHEPVQLKFHLDQEDGLPVSDLEPLMAAGGHCVIVSRDLRRFLHVHPLEDVAPDWRGGPEVVFETLLDEPQAYKAWVQFQHRGRILTAAFDLQASSAHH